MKSHTSIHNNCCIHMYIRSICVRCTLGIFPCSRKWSQKRICSVYYCIMDAFSSYAAQLFNFCLLAAVYWAFVDCVPGECMLVGQNVKEATIKRATDTFIMNYPFKECRRSFMLCNECLYVACLIYHRKKNYHNAVRGVFHQFLNFENSRNEK